MTRETLKLPEVTYNSDTKLIIFRATVLLLYAIALSLIYAFAVIDIKSLNKLSKYKTVFIFLIISLSVVIYLKYNIKYTNFNESHDILCITFVFFTVTFLVSMLLSGRLADIIDKLQKKRINLAIEEAKLQKGKYYAGLCFISDKLKSEMEYFQNELEKLGMDKDNRKSKLISFAAVLLIHEENFKNVSMHSRIYNYIALIIEVQTKTVESNISNALQNHWSQSDKKIILKIQENYHGIISQKNGAPTPRDFLIYLVEKYKKSENKAYKKDSKTCYKLFKRYSLDV